MRAWVGLIAVLACDGRTADVTDAPPADGTTADALPDAAPCAATGPATECNDCVDNDGDGRVDGRDIECSIASDDDESSFGIGFSIEPYHRQDCEFDGNSGAGDDGCNVHVCCILGAPSVEACPIEPGSYDPQACPPPIGTTPVADRCLVNCPPATRPGCDCFGCCTVCDPQTNACFDIITVESLAPNCDERTLDDPMVCTTCPKVTSCGGGECGGATCVLCPGQDLDDLPASCNGTNRCPNDGPICSDTEPCAIGTYCSSGCCIAAR